MGDVNKYLAYTVRANLFSDKVLSEAYMTLKFNKYFNFNIGQIKIPYTIESEMIPSNLETGFDMVITKLVGYNDVCGINSGGRDLGMSISGSAFDSEKNGEHFNRLNYTVALLNGYELMSADNDNRKNITGKIEVYPYDKDLNVSASFYKGTFTKNEISNGVRDRVAFGFHYNPSKGLYARSEYVSGVTASSNNNSDKFRSNGAYITLGYQFRFKPILDGDESHRLMPFAKYEFFNENRALNNQINIVSAGVAYEPFKFIYLKSYYTVKWTNQTILSNTFNIGLTLAVLH